MQENKSLCFFLNTVYMPRFIDLGPAVTEPQGFDMLTLHGRTDGRTDGHLTVL